MLSCHHCCSCRVWVPLWLVSYWPKQEIPSALPARTILRVTVGQRQWKEAAGKIVACRSILAEIVVSTGLFILWPWSGSEWMAVDRRGSWSERSFWKDEAIWPAASENLHRS